MSTDALIDEFAELHYKLAPLQKRYDQLKKELAKIAGDIDSTDAVEISNSSYSIHYSKPSQTKECRLSIPEFIKETGSYDSLTISLTQAKSNLTEQQFEDLFTVVQTKSRKLLEVQQIMVGVL